MIERRLSVEDLREALAAVRTGSGAIMRVTCGRLFCKPAQDLIENYDPAFWADLLLDSCIQALGCERDLEAGRPHTADAEKEIR